jgi:hypothetical protein
MSRTDFDGLEGGAAGYLDDSAASASDWVRVWQQ